MKTDSKIAAFRAKPATIVATVLLIGSFVAAVVLLVLINQGKTNDQRYLQQTSDLRAQAYRLTALARDATSGDEKAFGELTGVVASMSSTWDRLRNSDERTRKALSTEFDAFGAIWSRVQTSAKDIANNKDLIVSLNNVGNTLNDNLPTLQTQHNNIVDILLESGAPADQAIQAQLLSWRAERIGRNVDKMLRGDADAGNAADQFNRDANFYARVLTAMKNGDPALRITRVSDAQARASLEQITQLFDGVNKSIQEMVDGSTTLTRARQASDALLNDTPQLLQALATIADKISTKEHPIINNGTLIGLAAITLISLFFLGFNQYRGARRRADETAETNERNQTAILRLLDELADLADGDLTTTATVTEDFTGAIADSINFTIDQLRILVARINETAVNVSAAAQETQQTALHLAEASEHQAQEIAGASAAVNEMAVTIDQVSANAAESAAVAERAVSIAGNGAKVVQNTINGMDTIREQIQDTSKRIKRLGESSQEIGDIVSLINDIADQTNILALNAAIQASMAGDAGRGFAVVADEVQRLAERSAAATKQIEALVKTIQNDTNEAVISMEQTTSEVVRGARLAQDAGVALEEIENVSSSLAELIQNISNAARQQASSAGHISNTMNVIQEITTQTSAGTSATAQSIGNLAEMALDLRESVAGFKLPEEDMSESRANAARHAMATPEPTGFDQDTDVLTLDEELLPEDDIFTNASKA